MPDTGAGRQVIARVSRVKRLPDGRRAARVDGDGFVGFAVLEREISQDAADELQALMQEAIDSHMWEQHWGSDLPQCPEQP